MLATSKEVSMLSYLQQKYGRNLNKILYPRLDAITEMLSGDLTHPEQIPYVKESEMITVRKPRLMNYDFVVHLNHDLCAQYGGTPGVAKESSLRYALEVPDLTLFGERQFPELARAGAVMCHHMICGHVFVDGNKRTGWHTLSLFCAANGYLLEPEYPEEGRDAVLALCTKAWTVNQFAQWVNSNLIRR